MSDRKGGTAAFRPPAGGRTAVEALIDFLRRGLFRGANLVWWGLALGAWTWVCLTSLTRDLPRAARR